LAQWREEKITAPVGGGRGGQEKDEKAEVEGIVEKRLKKKLGGKRERAIDLSLKGTAKSTLKKGKTTRGGSYFLLRDDSKTGKKTMIP